MSTSKLLAVAVAALAVSASLPARAETLDQVVDGLKHTQTSLHDVTLHLKGKLRQGARLVDAELKVQAIPSLELRRMAFKAPAMMAGNIMVLDHHQVSSYLALTNQVIHADWNVAVKNAPLDFSRFSSITEGTLSADQFKLAGTDQLPAGQAFVLEETAVPSRLKVWVLKDGWRIGRIQAFNAQGLTQADWTVAEFLPNTGLSAAALKDLPHDAQVIQK